MSQLFGFSFLRPTHPSADSTAVRPRRLRRKVTSDAQLLEAWNTPSPIMPVAEDGTDTGLDPVDLPDVWDAPPDDSGWPEVDAPKPEDATDDATAADDVTATDDPLETSETDAVTATTEDGSVDDADIADDASDVMDGGAIADLAAEEDMEYVTSEDEAPETTDANEPDADATLANTTDSDSPKTEATDPETLETADPVIEDVEALDGDTALGSATDSSEDTDTSGSEAETDETGVTNFGEEDAADDALDDDALNDGDVTGAIADAEPQFKSGIFTVGESGEVGIDWLWDGGKYRGEAGIFSLSGLEEFEAGSEDFIREVTTRVLSSSESGHVVLSDHTDAARFDGKLDYEGDFNSGEYRGVQTFAMKAGDTFGGRDAG